MPMRGLPDHEEGRSCAIRIQYLEQTGRPDRVRAVVERERGNWLLRGDVRHRPEGAHGDWTAEPP